MDMSVENSEINMELIFQTEQTRLNAETNYSTNPNDAQNLTQWGMALLQLSQYGTLQDSKKMVKEAISKLEEAVKIDSQKHEALWHLGKAHSAEAFLASDPIEAQSNFEKADLYFQKALDEDPENEMYHKSLEANTQATLLHMQLQQGKVQQAFGGSSTSLNAKSSVIKANHDLMYDVFGWVLLGAGIVAWLGMAKSQAHPSPPR
ncbi:mitochondrial import receptor subunit TOM20-like isoform X1 [Lycium barbarum]|uniref:mitochondrial import receptor subunit TOM20-like isoform X1 n=1 Tax=Lycium barbarum TaxID=112863 RepID=UPI00293E6393|nr:mitochondrial import receptor subunit TOM20-like isoform X1 [Lycium barbarum]